MCTTSRQMVRKEIGIRRKVQSYHPNPALFPDP